MQSVLDRWCQYWVLLVVSSSYPLCCILKRSQCYNKSHFLKANPNVAVSLKSQLLLISKWNVWISSSTKAMAANVFYSFFMKIRQLPLLKVSLTALSMWTCRFPITCTLSWCMKGKQMLVTTGPSYTTSLGKAGWNTMTSQWQNHHGKSWREIHLVAWGMPVLTAWCT